MSTLKDSEIISQWQTAEMELQEARKEELALRNELIRRFTRTNDPYYEGVETIRVLDDAYLKISHRVNHNVIDNPEKVQKTLCKLEKRGVDVGRLIKFQPKLSLLEFRKLPQQDQKVTSSIIDLRPVQPSIKIQY